MNLALAVAFAALAAVSAAPVSDPTLPHLSQAWVAQSTGDGLPGAIGKESYIYDDCPHGKYTADCMRGHMFDYGADNCIKYEIDGGFHYEGTGKFYVKCDAVDCCVDKSEDPDPKKWDISATSWWKSTKTIYLGKHDTLELNNKTVANADVWEQVTSIPLAKNLAVNYTYYITQQGNDTISHRIDYIVPGQTSGTILYGDFQPQHDLAAFRKTFMPPPQCLKNNVLSCPPGHAKKVALKYSKHEATLRGWTQKDTSDAALPSGVNCKTDTDCPCSYCKNDKTKTAPFLCQAPKPGICCKTDKDCKANGAGSYCQTYKPKSGTASMPWHCHL